MMETSAVILDRIRTSYSKEIDLTLRQAFYGLLKKLGQPHQKLPPTLHVAGTNGKGSTCAFLRAFLETAGARVHVYTSPHLVSFHERIRLSGSPISEEDLSHLLTECEQAIDPGTISYFEATTAVAFMAFARIPADFLILEVGMGGRLDATNVIPQSEASIITRLSYDHCEFLGKTLQSIAAEKAGIMRPHRPCYTIHQPDAEARAALEASSQDHGTPLFQGERDWFVKPREGGFHFESRDRSYECINPALPGVHQIENAGLAIAALQALDIKFSNNVINQGLGNVYWPARLQRLSNGRLLKYLPPNFELWLDGGHNDSAGEVLGHHANGWSVKDPKPLFLVLGMLATKQPLEFLKPLASYISELTVLRIPGTEDSHPPDRLSEEADRAGIKPVHIASSLGDALSKIPRDKSEGRVLICGSLYLAGHVLKENTQ